MISCGLCTKNEKGMFEIHWTVEETFFSKLFKQPTEFKFMTFDLNVDNYLDLQYDNTITWFDENNEIVTSNKILKLINKKLKIVIARICVNKLKDESHGW